VGRARLGRPKTGRSALGRAAPLIASELATGKGSLGICVVAGLGSTRVAQVWFCGELAHRKVAGAVPRTQP
jgi:hypothetical protein